MTYRTIEVDGKKYEYVIGKHNTKIKRFGVYHNSDIGNEVKSNSKWVKKFSVTPKTIVLLIRGLPTPNPDFCYEHGMTTQIPITDFYSLQVDDTEQIIPACPKCAHELAMIT